jgi:2-amino-4-hydroxy-6-hydroxymethyldihydropteridine diphosphokinase
MALAVIALGSNIEPETNLAAGLHLLGAKVRLVAASRVFRTPPWGYAEQADFLNAVVTAETVLPPLELLHVLLQIEQERGRVRSIPNGPRTLDLDLLLVDELVLDSPRLTLPHPRLHERAFVLVPLCDLMPESRHPVLQRTFRQLLGSLPAGNIVPMSLELSVGKPSPVA